MTSRNTQGHGHGHKTTSPSNAKTTTTPSTHQPFDPYDPNTYPLTTTYAPQSLQHDTARTFAQLDDKHHKPARFPFEYGQLLRRETAEREKRTAARQTQRANRRMWNEDVIAYNRAREEKEKEKREKERKKNDVKGKGK